MKTRDSLAAYKYAHRVKKIKNIVVTARITDKYKEYISGIEENPANMILSNNLAKRVFIKIDITVLLITLNCLINVRKMHEIVFRNT